MTNENGSFPQHPQQGSGGESGEAGRSQQPSQYPGQPQYPPYGSGQPHQTQQPPTMPLPSTTSGAYPPPTAYGSHPQTPGNHGTGQGFTAHDQSASGQYPPAGQQPPRQPEKKGLGTGAKIGIAAGVVIVLAVIAMLVYVAFITDPGSQPTHPTQPVTTDVPLPEPIETDPGLPTDLPTEFPTEPVATIGLEESIELYNWEVVVHSDIQRASTIGPEYDQLTAQGEFVIIPMTVTNKGSDLLTFEPMLFTLIDSEGAVYAYDSAVDMPLDKDTGDGWFTPVDPNGGTLDGVIAIDVPADATITTMNMIAFDDPLGQVVQVDLGEV